MQNSQMTNLAPIAINSILDKKFFIRYYQRGYRWTKQQVEQLLDDIDSFVPLQLGNDPNNKTFYCLQPVVLKKLLANTIENRSLEGEWFEVIDGQQRLTSIYLILQYINDRWVIDKEPQFEIDYETRLDCENFLKDLKVNPDEKTVNINRENIDFYHISSAYQTIREWELNYKENHNGRIFNKTEFQTKFLGYSKIIWYQVEQDENSIDLFERLNLGKIPLTNAELTKALFLSAESFKDMLSEERKIKHFEVALLWDEMEQKLNEPDMKFWSFITNKKRNTYDTKIELILDLIADKPDNEKDPLFTFLRFSKENTDKKLLYKWKEIEQFYFTIMEWNNDRDLYHLIGYLISAKKVGDFKKFKLNELVKYSLEKGKKDLKKYIISNIKESIYSKSVDLKIEDFQYKEHSDRIFNILLLFNVETCRVSKSITEFYPFKQHKDNNWSLEHIHARNSDGLDKTKQEQWLKWLELHLSILKDLIKENFINEELKKKLNKTILDIEMYNNKDLFWNRFSDIFDNVNDILAGDFNREDIENDGLANLALLSLPDNSALNCTSFEVKRREIVRLDKEGSFIPLCTRRVFLGYYKELDNNGSNFFWEPNSRKKYLDVLKDTLKEYLVLDTNLRDGSNE